MKAGCLIGALLCALFTPVWADNINLKPVDFNQLPGWDSGNQLTSFQAFQNSCQKILMNPAYKPFGLGNWHHVCKEALADQVHTTADARAFFERYFVPMGVSDGSATIGLFTGYYTPEVEGSLRQHAEYQVPVYGRPKDLVVVTDQGVTEYGRLVNGQITPLPTRADIDNGALANDAKPVIWLKSKVDRFFLQVQGSGIVQLDNGQMVQLVFDGKNGQLYTAIGKVLVDMGAIKSKDVSMQTIRDWLNSHPDLADSVMDQNASYVFFKVTDTTIHPTPNGAAGVPLTPARSLAVDKQYIPLGVPLWLSTTVPQGRQIATFQQLVVAQDTGSAIQGPIRGDVFWGVGAQAAAVAGSMQSKGQYWVLLPKVG